MSVFEDVYVDGAEGSEVVDVYDFLLAVATRAGDGLFHGGIIFVLGLDEQRGYEDDVVRVVQISVWELVTTSRWVAGELEDLHSCGSLAAQVKNEDLDHRFGSVFALESLQCFTRVIRTGCYA